MAVSARVNVFRDTPEKATRPHPLAFCGVSAIPCPDRGGRHLRRLILACRRPWAESAVAAAWPAARSRSAAAGARWCPRTRPPAAAKLAPSAAGRSDVLRPERYARPPDILAQGDGSGCSQRHRLAWLSYSFTSARSIDAPYQKVRGAGPRHPLRMIGTLPRH